MDQPLFLDLPSVYSHRHKHTLGEEDTEVASDMQEQTEIALLAYHRQQDLLNTGPTKNWKTLTEPYDHQRVESVWATERFREQRPYFSSRTGGIAVCDDMGLGKTWMMVNHARGLINQGKMRHVFVVPKALLKQCANEFLKHMGLEANCLERKKGKLFASLGPDTLDPSFYNTTHKEQPPQIWIVTYETVDWEIKDMAWNSGYTSPLFGTRPSDEVLGTTKHPKDNSPDTRKRWLDTMKKWTPHPRWDSITLDEIHRVRNITLEFRSVFLMRRYTEGPCICVSASPFNNKIQDVGAIAMIIGVAPYANMRWWDGLSGGGCTTDKVGAYVSPVSSKWIPRFLISRSMRTIPTYSPPDVKKHFVELSPEEWSSYKVWADGADDAYKKYNNALSRNVMGARTNLFLHFTRMQQNANGMMIMNRAPDDGDRAADNEGAPEFGKKRQRPEEEETPCKEKRSRTSLVGGGGRSGTSNPTPPTTTSKGKALVGIVGASQKPTVVFSRWIQTLNSAQTQLENAGFSRTFRLDGKTNKKDKVVSDFLTACSEWWKHENDSVGAVSPVLFTTVQSGGTGLNLGQATRVIMLDRQFNPFLDGQAIRRIDRIDSVSFLSGKPTEVIYIVARHTIDIALEALHMRKLLENDRHMQISNLPFVNIPNETFGKNEVKSLYRATVFQYKQHVAEEDKKSIAALAAAGGTATPPPFPAPNVSSQSYPKPQTTIMQTGTVQANTMQTGTTQPDVAQAQTNTLKKCPPKGFHMQITNLEGHVLDFMVDDKTLDIPVQQMMESSNVSCMEVACRDANMCFTSGCDYSDVTLRHLSVGNTSLKVKMLL
jgi:hypothetical protein